MSDEEMPPEKPCGECVNGEVEWEDQSGNTVYRSCSNCQGTGTVPA